MTDAPLAQAYTIRARNASARNASACNVLRRRTCEACLVGRR
jgi:hypothetical protein